jgi:hypothetical protein
MSYNTNTRMLPKIRARKFSVAFIYIFTKAFRSAISLCNVLMPVQHFIVWALSNLKILSIYSRAFRLLYVHSLFFSESDKVY